ncbi:U2 snRNP complex subunit msl1 [Lignoscripta atroalba]|nr:U2 snRNP complex subunit msl1 [Lignoscripta atroalba]
MATHNGPPQKTSTSTGAPNHTLYLTNLPDKLQKQDLRLSLYSLFSTYGPVLDVVALKNSKMRGQAHIVFRDINASTQAMRALQGFNFFGKDMKIQYAKEKSNIFTKLEGVYRPPVAANAVTSTELQQSIFNAPPSSTTIPIPAAPTSAKAQDAGINGANVEGDGPQGVKRRREDESDDEGAPMEQDDSSESMEASSDED